MSHPCQQVIILSRPSTNIGNQEIKKSRNQETKKSRNQEIKKSRNQEGVEITLHSTHPGQRLAQE